MFNKHSLEILFMFSAANIKLSITNLRKRLLPVPEFYILYLRLESGTEGAGTTAPPSTWFL